MSIITKPSSLSVPLLATLSACGPVSASIYLPSMPAIGNAFEAGQAAVQLTFTSFFFGYAVSHLVLKHLTVSSAEPVSSPAWKPTSG